MNKLEKKAQSLYNPPFNYDKMGQIIFDADSNIVVDVRGWGRIKGMENASAIHDELGRQIALALTTHWRSQKNQDFQELELEDLGKKLQKEVGSLGLSNEVFNLCREVEFKIVNDLVRHSKTNLWHIFSERAESLDKARKAVREVEDVLLNLGLTLGMKIF